MPLTYHLWPLDTLLDVRFMPSTVDNATLAVLPARKAALKAALAAYCSQLLHQGDLSSCDAPGPSPKPTKPVSVYLGWAYKYMPAAPTYHDYKCPGEAYLTQMWWREDPGEGLVSLKASCSDGTSLLWSNDTDGSWNQVLSCSDGFASITGKAQSGYGIINVKVDCIGNQTFESNHNPEGEWEETLACPSDAPTLVGLEVMFQTSWPNNYGIVNYRPRCSNGALLGYRRRLQQTYSTGQRQPTIRPTIQPTIPERPAATAAAASHYSNLILV